jgi:hypothetical protein
MIDDDTDAFGIRLRCSSGTDQINGASAALETGESLVFGSSDLFGFGDCFAEGVDGGDGV